MFGRKKHMFVYIVFVFVIFVNSNVRAEKIHLYIDADRTGTKESGISIEQGIKTALNEVGNKLGNREVELIVLDHKGSGEQSKRHIEKYLDDNNALAVFCGLHSPPVLKNKDFINKKKILLLDPWAAAGPITRCESGENWIFRLSVDDTKAGFVIAGHAIIRRGFRKPHLLLENTGWGKSNEKTMTKALTNFGMSAPPVTWFEWGVKESEALSKLRKITGSGADVIFFVANAPEAKTFVKAKLSLPESQRRPIMSHWGITGGDFPKVINSSMRKELDLEFIQTRFSFLNIGSDPFGQNVFQRAKSVFPDAIRNPEDIKAPAGFVHAYDLTRLLIAAVNKTGLSGNITEDRMKIRNALEHLEKPVGGLIKTYQQPFSPYTKESPDAHEALGIKDYTMASYGQEGEIILKGSMISR